MGRGGRMAWWMAAVAMGTEPLATSHPTPLPERVGCERYEGKASGNDPTVRIVLRLCPEDTRTHGQLQWSSLQSGWNVRKITGTRTGAGYTLSDVSIVEEKPRLGWRFCTIDAYELTLSAGKLNGTFTSAACNDSGTLSLTAMGNSPDPELPVEPPAGDPTAAPASWGCAVASGGTLSGVLGLMLVLTRPRCPRDPCATLHLR